MNLKLEELVIEKIIFFIYTKQLSLKHLMVLPKHVQKNILWYYQKMFKTKYLGN